MRSASFVCAALLYVHQPWWGRCAVWPLFFFFAKLRVFGRVMRLRRSCPSYFTRNILHSRPCCQRAMCLSENARSHFSLGRTEHAWVLVFEMRGRVELSSRRRNEESVVIGLWNGEVCQMLEGPALCWGKHSSDRACWIGST